jgi:hypothetical protein
MLVHRKVRMGGLFIRLLMLGGILVGLEIHSKSIRLHLKVKL